MSPLVWGAWIETEIKVLQDRNAEVAPRMGGVD